MASIKLRRGSGVPSGLTFGEPAFDITNSRLYVGITGGSALVGVAGGGVHSFNGLTGAVTGVTTGTANTFGPLQSFTNGISSAGGTFANSVNFLSGLSATGITLTSGSSVTRIIPTSIRASSGFNITGATVAAPSIYNSVNCPISGNLTLESRSGIIDIDAGLSSKTVTYSTGLRFLGANYDVIPEQTYSTILYGSVASGNTLYLPSSSGTLALSSEVTGLQRVTSFNGLTGAVTGVTTGTSNIFGPLQSFTNGISSAGGTFTADIRVNNHTIGRGGGSIVTNVAFGVLALGANTTGLQNTSLGQNSLFANTVGNNNTAVGRRSLFTVTGGSQNVAVGTSSLNNFTGNRTTGLGFSAAAAVSAGTGGIYIGDSVVGTNNSTNEIVIGTDAIGLGSNTAVIGTSTQTLARINGLVDVPSGISASGGTFSGPVSSSGFILTSAGIKSLTGTTYTFLSSDNGDVLTHNNASGCTLTIPSGLPVGFSVTLIQLNATGRIGFTAASGVTLNVYGGFTGMAGQHASASLVSYASNIYNLSGNLI